MDSGNTGEALSERAAQPILYFPGCNRKSFVFFFTSFQTARVRLKFPPHLELGGIRVFHTTSITRVNRYY